ncbi:MAG: hypothetical protein COW84_01435 [Gammaproteobacteria bacterium CG22_combo_CG10-13_8_21_14_all_40_8]|nr:MAG: hypothetical protein COW84_01435 [Gammaproteobacteria bacterium CG22_combo_CG10-13_8_21_14_all_40_8]
MAEYVESEAIVKLLRELKVDYIQGYHLGAPSALVPDPPN